MLFRSINLVVNKDESNGYYVINIYKEIKLITPGLNRILDNPYKISVKRVIYYDES